MWRNVPHKPPTDKRDGASAAGGRAGEWAAEILPSPTGRGVGRRPDRPPDRSTVHRRQSQKSARPGGTPAQTQTGSIGDCSKEAKKNDLDRGKDQGVATTRVFRA